MMISWRFQKRDKTAWLVSFFFGFFLGIVMICLFSEALVMQTGFLDPDFLYGIRHLKINQNGLFLYSLRLRLGMAAFLVLLSMAGAAGIGSSLTLVWCGLSAGSVLTVLSLRYGIRGILLFLACVLPQQLLLIPGLLMLMDWCYHREQRYRLLIPLAVVIMGCFLESYVNPYVFKVVLKIF